MAYFRQRENSLIWQSEDEKIQLEPWGKNSLRVRATINATIRDDVPQALMAPDDFEATIEVEEESATICNGLIEAQISRLGGVSFYNRQTGKELLVENRQKFPQAERRLKFLGGGLSRAPQCRFRTRTRGNAGYRRPRGGGKIDDSEAPPGHVRSPGRPRAGGRHQRAPDGPDPAAAGHRLCSGGGESVPRFDRGESASGQSGRHG